MSEARYSHTKKKLLWAAPNVHKIKPLKSPKGYESVPVFASRHGLAKMFVYNSLWRAINPLPHLLDEVSGNYFIPTKKGDKWVAEMKARGTQAQQMLYLLSRQLKMLQTTADQLRSAGYQKSHDACLQLIETFREETGYENLLQSGSPEDKLLDEAP